MRIDGTRYVADAAPWTDNGALECSLSEGSIEDAATHIVAESPMWSDDLREGEFTWRAWDVTSEAVYLGYGDRLYQVPRR